MQIKHDAPVATTAARDYRARGHVTRPDPERSGAVEIATGRCPRLRLVWDLRELTHQHKTQAVEPSRQTWSSYGPPYLPVAALVLVTAAGLYTFHASSTTCFFSSSLFFVLPLQNFFSVYLVVTDK